MFKTMDQELHLRVVEKFEDAYATQVVEVYPIRSRLQLVRCSEPTFFICHDCKKRKRAKLVALRDRPSDRLICNGCYGHTIVH